LAQLGTIAIARCKPTNQVSNLSTFLSETYRDGLPKLFGATLWKERTRAARAAGGEYLNKEFGWDPLVGDVRTLARNITHAHAVLSQYERDSGQVVRRRYTFPVEQTSTTSLVVSNFTPVLVPDGNSHFAFWGGGNPRTNVYKHSTSWKQVWFSGAFTYHLPSGYRSRNAMAEYAAKADVLLGLNLSPETVWNALPWTWAIDWFSNAGDVVSNLSDWATDGLVLKYGYVMEHSFFTDTYFQMDEQGLLKGSYFHTSPVIACVETKRREVATPFGFGLNWSGLSPRQLAIAAALGLTRR
jgi:hypothetical protein